jgi:hypothetical protein
MRKVRSMVKKTFIMLIMLWPGITFSQYERPGSSAAQFLNIGVNARAESMAGSYISQTQGAEATYYNPAALAALKELDASFNYTSWFAGIKHGFMAIAYPLGSMGVLAFSATALTTDEMEVRTPLQPDGTGETFYSGDYRVGLSYAVSMTDRVRIGITGNYIKLYLYRDFIEGAFAGDVGVLYDSGVKNFRFGLKISNFGSNIKFINESYPMPTSFSFGMSFNAIEGTEHTVLLSATALKPNDGGPQGALGTEYGFHDLVFLRAGYNIDDPVKTFAFGVGAKLSLSTFNLRVDYSYNDFSDLGGAQRLTLGISL